MKSFRAFLLLGGALTLLGTPLELAAWPQQDANAAMPLSRDYPVKPVPFTAVHFHDAFWLPRIETNRTVTIPFAPTIASSSTVASSVAKNARSIQDEEVPPHSWDRNPYADFDWTPHMGTTDWVEYDFAKPAKVSSTAVFWIDNRGHLNPDCGTPKSWRILYRDGDQWKPVANREPFATGQDRFNKVTFVPVVTSALRLEVVEQPEWSAGIHEWTVE
jgi:hypothetical protein